MRLCTLLRCRFVVDSRCNLPPRRLCGAKGQLVSKRLFCAITFFQKTNENKSKNSKVEFVRSFFGRYFGLKKSFRICVTFSAATFTRNSMVVLRERKTGWIETQVAIKETKTYSPSSSGISGSILFQIWSQFEISFYWKEFVLEIIFEIKRMIWFSWSEMTK